jgi:hypothetical protein
MCSYFEIHSLFLLVSTYVITVYLNFRFHAFPFVPVLGLFVN